MELNTILLGDCLQSLKTLPENSVDCCVTSPPYYALRDYGCEGQIGLEETPEAYIEKLTEVFEQVRRVLKTEGTLWLNIGDSYSGNCSVTSTGRCGMGKPREKIDHRVFEGIKPKDLIGIPWMLAFSLRKAGWYLRQDIIWCLSGGTYLYVKSQKGVSPMMIKDMIRLDPSTIQLWNGEKWVNVLGYGESNATGEKYELVLRSGERIGCTEGHKWMLENGREVLAKDLKVGDILKSCNFSDEGTHKPSFMIADVRWLLGLYLAEGSLSGDCIQLALCSDEVGWIERIRTAVEHLGGTITYDIDGGNLSVRIYSQVLFATIHQYLGGHTAKDKHLNNICWQMPNDWLRDIAEGYFDGDGHRDGDRIRLGFTRNYNLERDLRVLASRLGATITLNLSHSTIDGKNYPSFRGEWRYERSGHFNEKSRSEIVEIRRSRARHFYDISVESDDHLFSLASGVLTHNCKPNPMPESVTDRCTKSHEYLFLLSKSQRYYFDHEAIQEDAVSFNPDRTDGHRIGGNKYSQGLYQPELKSQRTQEQGYAQAGGHKDNSGGLWKGHEHTRTKNCQYDGQEPNSMHLRREEGLPDEQHIVRNKRDVWSVNLKPNKETHFATYPEKLISPCILAGCPEGGVVLDPFMGSGTTGIVAKKLNRNYIGCELNPDYKAMAERRIELIGDTLF